MRKNKLMIGLIMLMVFIYGAYPLSCCSSIHTAWADSEKQLDRAIYFDPWLVFQSGLDEDPSSYFLVAFNTASGALIPIHQGYHRDFWLHEESFYFFHAGRYFVCPWAQWDQAQLLPQAPSDTILQKRHITYLKDLPSELRAVDPDDIHRVIRGSFTFPARNELLFISGQKKGYFLAVYSHARDTLQLEAHEVVAFEMPGQTHHQRPMFFFREALTEDFDRDGCLELLINGTFTAWDYPGDSLLYIDFSRPRSGETFQLIDLPRTTQGRPLQAPRLHRQGHQKVQVQFGLRDYFEETAVDYYDFTMDSEGLVQLQYAETKPFSFFPEEGVPLHQDFYSSFESLKTAKAQQTFTSILYPELILPVTYEDDPVLPLEQRMYHRERNKAIEQWMEKMEQGWNPFEDIKKVSESLENPEILISQWTHWVDLIPIRLEQDLHYYVAPHLFQTGSYTLQLMMMLYDNSLQLIDVRCPCQEEYIMGHPLVFPDESMDPHQFMRILLPSPGERTFMVLFPDQKMASSYQAIGVSRFGFFTQYQHRGFVWRYFPHASGYKLEAIVSYALFAPWGYGPGLNLPFLSQIEPTDGQGVPHLFIYRYQQHLKELYRWLPLFDHSTVNTASDEALLHPIVAVVEAYESLIFYQDSSTLRDLD